MELHHHDVVHFALEFLERAGADGQGERILDQLRNHLQGIENSRPKDQDAPPAASGTESPPLQ
jgi:hypothetical protein